MTYDVAFTGVNVLGTAIGVGEEFAFPNSSSARYVRLEGDLAVDEWMSVNEVRRVGVANCLSFRTGCVGLFYLSIYLSVWLSACLVCLCVRASVRALASRVGLYISVSVLCMHA